ncbi:hypothetical protein TYRP_022637 [Tyrophagus putrescentiae]|nr:hypothetical protein TYRP_022637 [Tyrophagus putrescentiae]
MIELLENLLEKIRGFLADPGHLALVIVGAFLVTLAFTCCCLCCLVCCGSKKRRGKSSKNPSNHRQTSLINFFSCHSPPPPPPPEPRLSQILLDPTQTPSAPPTLGQPHPSMLRSLRNAQQLRAERLGHQHEQILYYSNDQERYWLAGGGGDSGHHHQQQVNTRPRVNWDVPGTFGEPVVVESSAPPPPSYAEANKNNNRESGMYPYIPPPTYD